MFVVCNSVKVLYFNEIIKIALSGRVSDVCARDAFVRLDGRAEAARGRVGGGWGNGRDGRAGRNRQVKR